MERRSVCLPLSLSVCLSSCLCLSLFLNLYLSVCFSLPLSPRLLILSLSHTGYTLLITSESKIMTSITVLKHKVEFKTYYLRHKMPPKQPCQMRILICINTYNNYLSFCLFSDKHRKPPIKNNH